MKKITFNELKKLNKKAIVEVKEWEEPTEGEKGILNINGVKVFNCFRNEVCCDNDSYAIITFYDKRDNVVANISVANINDECLIVDTQDRIYSETSIRLMNR